MFVRQGLCDFFFLLFSLFAYVLEMLFWKVAEHDFEYLLLMSVFIVVNNFIWQVCLLLLLSLIAPAMCFFFIMWNFKSRSYVAYYCFDVKFRHHLNVNPKGSS